MWVEENKVFYEHFRKLIKKTFDDYYPLEYNKSTFDMDEYLAVVDKM